jgi:Site-specific DNA methylase
MDFTLKPPTFFQYIGGKQYLLKHLLPLIPQHKTYVEPFCGSAKLFFAKTPSQVEVLNDKNKLIANLFYCVSFHFDEFYQKVSTLVYSRVLYDMFKQDVETLADLKIPDVDVAVKTYYLFNTSFAGKVFGGFGVSKTKNEAKSFHNKISSLHLIHERLKNAQIECSDFEEVIRRYDSEDTFFYLDPPYYGAELYYDANFTEEDHKRLLSLLKQVRGKWLLSGYSNELYENELKEFNRLEFQAVKHSYGLTQNSKQKERPQAVEVVWFNYEIDKSKLFR